MNIAAPIREYLRNTKRRLAAGSKARAYQAVLPPDAYPIGSSEWLIAAEKNMGGLVRNVKRRTLSPLDHRTADQIKRGGMTGGDRMFHHGYAALYAESLKPFVHTRHREFTIVEVGILKGTGLAVWSLLFPNARIIGLDIDLSYTQENMKQLRARGAFAKRDPELYRFDQLASTSDDAREILNGAPIDICVDDGLHSDPAIIHTAHVLRPHLADRAVYFIEDSFIEAEKIRPIFWDTSYAVYKRSGQLTVVELHPPS